MMRERLDSLARALYNCLQPFSGTVKCEVRRAMETTNVACSNCGQLMAIDPDHLGREVECPHCQHLMAAPPPADATITMDEASLSEPVIQVPSAADREDIFTPLEETPGSDVFGLPPSRPVV